MSIATEPRSQLHRALIEERLRERNIASRGFFDNESSRLAAVCALMSGRFARGGRLLAFGHGSAATDAQHVAVEFVHPILVGKRALPALDLSSSYRHALAPLLRPDDIVMGLSGPHGDVDVTRSLDAAAAGGALVLALPGPRGDYAVQAASMDPFIHQELMEVLYHALWETVHVFLERHGFDSDAGRASFLYPFLSDQGDPTATVFTDVAASIRAKAACDERLREEVARDHTHSIVAAADGIRERIARGGIILCFGNGGSATDATDLASDLVSSPKGYLPIPAVSLSADAATLTALANDVGAESLYARQIMAYGRPPDVAVAISTSGGSANVIAALREARKRGMLTVALLGYDGGEIARHELAEHTIVVRSDQIPRVQEVQASIYHVMIDVLDAMQRE